MNTTRFSNSIGPPSKISSPYRQSLNLSRDTLHSHIHAIHQNMYSYWASGVTKA